MLACDAAQIEQLIINLTRNAVEAALEQRMLGGAQAGVRMAWRKNAAAAELVIEDDGPGVAQATNLFVPFFTTKPEGSGIGAFQARELLREAGGDLLVTSRPGQGPDAGTTMRLLLPLVEATEHEPASLPA